MSETLRVFVNGTGVDLPAGSSVLDAVSAVDAAAAAAIRAGTRAAVDSRGLPVSGDTPLHGGFVMRIVSARALRTSGER